MTRREMNLRVFRREPLPHVFFQPRFEPWFWLQRENGTLPAELRGMTLFQACDLLDA